MPLPFLDPIKQRLKNAVKATGLKETALRLSYRRGLPSDLDANNFASIIERETGHKPKSVIYRQMSGWKKSGAYRLAIRTMGGTKFSLIFKNALYSKQEIPALESLPIIPGRGEFTYFNNMNDDLKRFLPTVFLIEEVIPGVHYQYVMEDLTLRYRSAAGDADIVTLCDQIPDIHETFATIATHPDTKSLPVFGYDFAKMLLQYGKRSLDAYQRARPDPAVDALLKSWDEFTSNYHEYADVTYREQPLILIHGDCHTSNVMYPLDGGTIKVLDLEWAGWGLPHHDLAVALNRAPKHIELQCVTSFSRRQGPGRLDADWIIYRVCRIERALLDAAFIARQTLYAEARMPSWFPELIARSCTVCLDLSRALKRAS